MHELHELKDKLVKELEEYGRQGDLSAGSLDVVDKLAHATKNLCKVIEDMEDGGYSSRYDGSYRYGGNSMARGRGRNARRDSMGRYSSEDMAQRLRDMSYDAPDERTRQDMERLASKMESM